MPKCLTMTNDEFTVTYKPILNVYVDEGERPENDCMFETYGEELATVRLMLASYPDKVWTILNGDEGEWLICNGYHFVNRIGYLITEVPCPPNTEITVEDEFSEDDEYEEG